MVPDLSRSPPANDTRQSGGALISLLHPKPPIRVFLDPSPNLVIDIIRADPVVGRLDLGFGPFDGLARPGSFIVRPAHRPTSIESNSRGVSLLSVSVPVGRADAALSAGRVDVEFLHTRVHADPLVVQIAQRLWAEAGPGSAGDTLFSDHALNALVALVLQRVCPAAPPASPPRGRLSFKQLSAVVDYLHDHLDRPVTLDDLAAVVHVSRFHFARLFKLTTGQPPYQFVVGLRVERAKALLRSGDHLTLAQVAAACGFYDQSQFTKHFRRVVGVTPKQFV